MYLISYILHIAGIVLWFGSFAEIWIPNRSSRDENYLILKRVPLNGSALFGVLVKVTDVQFKYPGDQSPFSTTSLKKLADPPRNGRQKLQSSKLSSILCYNLVLVETITE